MTYVESWAEFQEGAQRIYIANPGAVRQRPPKAPTGTKRPRVALLMLLLLLSAEHVQNCCLQTRYSVKYRHTDGKLVLKVTDDTTVSRTCPCAFRCASSPAQHSPWRVGSA